MLQREDDVAAGDLDLFDPLLTSPVKGHIGQRDFPHLLKPALCSAAADLILIEASFGASLALHSVSFMFFRKEARRGAHNVVIIVVKE